MKETEIQKLNLTIGERLTDPKLKENVRAVLSKALDVATDYLTAERESELIIMNEPRFNLMQAGIILQVSHELVGRKMKRFNIQGAKTTEDGREKLLSLRQLLDLSHVISPQHDAIARQHRYRTDRIGRPARIHRP